MPSINCPKCNSECTDNSSFCTNCGFNLAVYRATLVKPTKVCPECTNECYTADTTCKKCGYPFSYTQQPLKVNTPIQQPPFITEPSKTKTCPECSNQNAISQTACTKCGFPFGNLYQPKPPVVQQQVVTSNVQAPQPTVIKTAPIVPPAPKIEQPKIEEIKQPPIVQEETKQNEEIAEEKSSFSWLIVCTAVALLLVASGVATYFFYLKPKWRDEAAPRYYTMAQDVVMRSSKQAGVDYNFVQTLRYGTELITYEYGGDWSNVKANDKEGYVASPYIIEKKDFLLLNSIWGDVESKETINTNKCRLALLNYFKEHNYIGKMTGEQQHEAFGVYGTDREVWQVFSKGKGRTPNTIFFPHIVNPDSKFSDFAVVIKNNNTQQRKLLLFAFLDDEKPYFVNEQSAPQYGDIVSIKKVNFQYMVKWTTSY